MMSTAICKRYGFLVLATVMTTTAVGCGSGDDAPSAATEADGSPSSDDSGMSSSDDTSTPSSDTSDPTDTATPPTDGSAEVAPEAAVDHCPTTYPRYDLKKDFKAVGDGVTDDTKALNDAAVEIQKKGGGELVIPPGVYRVGKQTEKKAGESGEFYRTSPMFSATGLKCLKISGYGAKLRIADGLHYGGFNPTNGSPGDYTGGTINRADVGRIIELSNSANVLIEGVELDGNNEKLVLGGQWGDVNIQAQAAGLWFNECTDVSVVDVYTHHHGLDGITVLHLDGPLTAPKMHKLLRVRSEYNGRQALSWIGGWGLEATDSKFNHTGRAMNAGKPMMSAPRAGLDIEPNPGTTQKTRGGVFTRCEFINNAGAGVLTAGSDAGYATFKDCTIWGTTNYSLYILHPGMKFENSRIYGTAVHGSDGSTGSGAPNPMLATQFEGCTFEDKPWTDGKVFRNAYLYNLSEGAAGLAFRRCTFINHAVRTVYVLGASTAEIFDSCTFIHSNPDLASGTYQTRIEGARMKSCTFKESAELTGGSRNYFIDFDGTVESATPPTHVDGPKVKFDSISGPTGDIAARAY